MAIRVFYLRHSKKSFSIHRLRSIKNKHTEDLVFLRITDIVQGEQSEVVTLQTENINAAEILIDVATGFKSSFSKFTQMVHGKRSETK